MEISIISQLIINSIIAGAIYALVALGFNLLYKTTKFFNLAHGAIITIGGYGTFAALKIFETNTYVAIAFGILAAGVVGFLCEKLVFKNMRKNNASSSVMLVASLGLLTLLQAILTVIFGASFQTLYSEITATKPLEVFGGFITHIQLSIIVLAITLLVLLATFLKYSKLGKAIQAISDDEETAKIIGINTDTVIAKVFIIASVIAGVSGIAVGFDSGIEPAMGMSLLLKGVVAAVIGGIGNVYGGVIGAFLLGLLENFGIWAISGQWKDLISFGILIVFLIFRPQGIFNKKATWST